MFLLDLILALTLDLDVMVLDFEDGVALNQKPKARELVAQALAHSDFGRTERTIRMNAVHSGEERFVEGFEIFNFKFWEYQQIH